MHRRKRIRKQNMPSLMDIDGEGINLQPVAPSKKGPEDTNIETLSKQLNKIDISHMAKNLSPRSPSTSIQANCFHLREL